MTYEFDSLEAEKAHKALQDAATYLAEIGLGELALEASVLADSVIDECGIPPEDD